MTHAERWEIARRVSHVVPPPLRRIRGKVAAVVEIELRKMDRKDPPKDALRLRAFWPWSERP